MKVLQISLPETSIDCGEPPCLFWIAEGVLCVWSQASTTAALLGRGHLFLSELRKYHLSYLGMDLSASHATHGCGTLKLANV